MKLLKMKLNNTLNNSLIIYANFDVGFNLGSIPKYLVENYEDVILYSIYFPDIVHNGDSNITVFKKGSLSKVTATYTSKSKDVFSVILYYLSFFVNLSSIRLRNLNKNIVLISSNPYLIFFGNLLKLHTIYIVGDIMRISKNNIISRLKSNITAKVLGCSLKHADHRWYISRSLKNYFRGSNIKKGFVQSLGIDNNTKKLVKTEKRVLYIGTFDKAKGIALIDSVAKNLDKYQFVFVGGNATYQHNNTSVYTPVVDEVQLRVLLGNYNYIAVAPYMPDAVKYLGDPTKIKQYLSYGYPVITTACVEFSKIINKYHAGIVIDYSEKQLYRAILTIANNYQYYVKGVHNLLNAYYYEDLYKPVFKKQFGK